MNRGDIYKLLASTLEEYRAAEFDELALNVGAPMAERSVRVGGEEVMLSVTIDWVDGRQNALRIEITAAGPSCWMTDRVSESIIISSPIH